MTKDLVGRSQEQVSPNQRTSKVMKSMSRKLRSTTKEPSQQSRSSVVAGRVRQSEALNVQASMEGAPQHIIMPTGSGGPTALEPGGLNRSTVSNVRSHVPTEKANGVHDTQSTNKISAAEQKLTQSSQKPLPEQVRTLIDERASAARTDESRERTHLQVTGNMSISADSQVQESNEEYNDATPGLPAGPNIGLDHRNERVGHSQTIVMKTLGAIQEAPAN